MNTSKWFRQIHRWLAMVFTTTVIANLVGLALGEELTWAIYSLLPPIGLLAFTGLYMFFLPYVIKHQKKRMQA